jgi:hypothetical protein
MGVPSEKASWAVGDLVEAIERREDISRYNVDDVFSSDRQRLYKAKERLDALVGRLREHHEEFAAEAADEESDDSSFGMR